MIETGVNLTDLMCSKVFEMDIEFPEWDSSHTEKPHMYQLPAKRPGEPGGWVDIMPYNKSIFDLRKEYANIFPEYYEET